MKAGPICWSSVKTDVYPGVSIGQGSIDHLDCEQTIDAVLHLRRGKQRFVTRTLQLFGKVRVEWVVHPGMMRREDSVSIENILSGFSPKIGLRCVRIASEMLTGGADRRHYKQDGSRKRPQSLDHHSAPSSPE